MNDINTDEFLRVSKLSPEERFEYTLAHLIKHKEIWGLHGKDGWILLKADEDACLPVWPDASFAQAWEKNDFPDCEPRLIEYDAWMEQWLPGMKANGTLILVFPLSEDEEGIMLTAEEVQGCIEDDLKGTK